jgi:hypothetical protein
MVKLAHSFIARYMATNARTPAERAAVNWNSVISHVDQGITEDFDVYGDDILWWSYLKSYGEFNGWARADMRTVGPADQGGGYQNWIASPVEQRNQFYMTDVEDLRISNTATGEARDSGTHFGMVGNSPFRVNRGTYHYSYYNHLRWIPYWEDWLGDMTMMRVEEMNLLKAEGLYRTGNVQGAVDLINLSRVANGGLPPLTVDGVPEIDGKSRHGRTTVPAATSGTRSCMRRSWSATTPPAAWRSSTTVAGASWYRERRFTSRCPAPSSSRC